MYQTFDCQRVRLNLIKHAHSNSNLHVFGIAAHLEQAILYTAAQHFMMQLQWQPTQDQAA
jgi:hypothetical protein